MDAAKFVDVIDEAMKHLAVADYEHRTAPEFLELLEEGEDWVTKIRKFLGTES